jgi:hypothetical protein
VIQAGTIRRRPYARADLKVRTTTVAVQAFRPAVAKFRGAQPFGADVRLPIAYKNLLVRMKICPSEMAGELSV